MRWRTLALRTLLFATLLFSCGALLANGDAVNDRIKALLTASATKVTNVKRMALLFGAEEYPYQRNRWVTNAWNDVNAFASALERAGFDDIEVVSRPTRVAVLERLQAFREKGVAHFSSTGISPFAVVVFAGHGFHINTHNYFLPIDAQPGDSASLKDWGVTQAFVAQQLKFDKYSFGMIIFDTCRVDLGWQASHDDLLGGGPTLDESLAAANLFIVYASGKGTPALSRVNDTDTNSPFTKAYTEAMLTRDLELIDLYKEVRRAVKHHSGGTQIPMAIPATDSSFYFRPGEQHAHAVSSAWRDLVEQPTKKKLETFIEKYPVSEHTAVALEHLKMIGTP